ncbi:MAG: GDP-mannose 4,6-dehydratase [Chloroflexi bacterium]|nr:GDP-mannose 4,6-dehydratase [Chloroflexota bacterium]
MSSYLISGVAGSIGARTAELLLEEGHRVIGVDNLNDAYDVRMKEYRLRRLQRHPAFRFHRLDISERAQVLGDTSPIEKEEIAAVIHLAARAGVRASVENPWIFLETNLIGTLNMLEWARQHGVPKFIFASTSSIYGSNPPLPTPEDASSDRPLQPYAASKKGAEALCHSYHYLYGLDVTILRYFTVYGPAGRPDLAMFRFCQWIHEGRPVRVNGDGEQSRGFTYVDDIAHGTILALKPLGYEIINLGGHEVITINALIRLFEEVIGQRAQVIYGPPNPADMLTNWADVSKARRLLGWEPRVSLREGVERLVEWYRQERSWAREILTV